MRMLNKLLILLTCCLPRTAIERLINFLVTTFLFDWFEVINIGVILQHRRLCLPLTYLPQHRIIDRVHLDDHHQSIDY